MTIALITGISGQDGAYLAQQLLARGIQVVGTSRDPDAARRSGNLPRLGIAEDIGLRQATSESGATRELLDRVAPDVIYHLAGQSSVGLSFQEPVRTVRSLVDGTLELCEALRAEGGATRLVVAGSGDAFGETGTAGATEATPMQPANPYAAGKTAARGIVAAYRTAYGLHAATALLFNHESPLRSDRFVTAKIARGALRIAADLAAGRTPEPLHLGELAIQRDWGWAPEYMEALAAMATLTDTEDLVIATGRPCPLETFVAAAFAEAGLDWRDHVRTDPSLIRRQEARISCGDPARAHARLGWSARTAGPAVAARLVRELRSAAGR